METLLIIIVVVLAGALILFATMFWRTSAQLIAVQNTQHERQVDADRCTAQAITELSVYVKDAAKASLGVQSILTSMHRDVGEMSGDASRNHVVLENRLQAIDGKQAALLDLISEMYKQTSAADNDLRNLLDTLSTELRAYISTHAAPASAQPS